MGQRMRGAVQRKEFGRPKWTRDMDELSDTNIMKILADTNIEQVRIIIDKNEGVSKKDTSERQE